MVALLIVDAVPLDEFEKIPLGVAGQRRLGEVRIATQVSMGARLQIGEVAAPTTADQDLAPRLLGIIQHQHSAPPIPGLSRTHQTGRSGPDDDHIPRILWFHNNFSCRPCLMTGAIVTGGTTRITSAPSDIHLTTVVVIRPG